MAQPGILSSQIPPGEDHVMRALADIRREMRELGPSIMHSFQSIVDDLAAQQATLTAQQATLTTTVAGLTTAQATLATAVSNIAANLASLNAIIGAQVAAAVGHDDNGATNFAVTTTRTTVASVTFSVPAGYTRALILAVAQADAVNTTAAVDTLIVGAYLNGTFNGIAAAQDVAPGGFGGATKATARLLTGLTGGGTFTVSTGIYSQNAGWATQAANSCNIDAAVIFLR